MATSASIRSQLDALVGMLFNVPGFAADEHTQLAEIPGFDSLAGVSLMFAIEQEFGVSFAEGEFRADSTFEELAAVLAAKAS